MATYVTLIPTPGNAYAQTKIQHMDFSLLNNVNRFFFFFLFLVSLKLLAIDLCNKIIQSHKILPVKKKILNTITLRVKESSSNTARGGYTATVENTRCASMNMKTAAAELDYILCKD